MSVGDPIVDTFAVAIATVNLPMLVNTKFGCYHFQITSWGIHSPQTISVVIL